MEETPRHQCVIYDGSPAKMLPAIAGLIDEKINQNIRCLYLNSPTMVVGLRSYLSAIGINVAKVVAEGRLILSSDQTQTKSGLFDADEMLRKLQEAVIQATSDGYRGLWASGDMTWELGRDRNLQKLLEYERKLEALFRKHPDLSGLCQYHLGTLPTDMVCNGLVSHPTIFINQTLSRINPHYLGSDAPNAPTATTAALKYTIQNLCALQLEDGSCD